MPAYARHTEFDRPEIVRVLTEHVDLRRRGQDLETGVPNRTRCANSASGSSATSASRSASSSR